jgi:DNA-binding XRE family transcriptional regulator
LYIKVEREFREEKEEMEKNEKVKERIKICEKYGAFFDSFNKQEKDKTGIYGEDAISKEIYHQVFKIRYYAGKYSAESNREINHSFSGIFQDLIACYLNVFLGNEYKVLLEKKEQKFQPDILIQKNGVNHFIIEVKTNIGWGRNDIKDGIFDKRIENLSKVFDVKKENIIYIFESYVNVSKEFSAIYWDENNSRPKEHPKEEIYSKIYPLFNSTDPYYMEEFKEEELYLKTFEDEEIEKLAVENIVSKFENIIKLITK